MDRGKKLGRRLEQIQKWLGFSDAALDSWNGLGKGFLNWLVEQTDAKNLPADQVRAPLQYVT